MLSVSFVGALFFAALYAALFFRYYHCERSPFFAAVHGTLLFYCCHCERSSWSLSLFVSFRVEHSVQLVQNCLRNVTIILHDVIMRVYLFTQILCKSRYIMMISLIPVNIERERNSSRTVTFDYHGSLPIPVTTKVTQLRRSALRFFHSHSGATVIFCLICRTVYFRCAANLIAASGQICVRRLRVGDLLIKILLHCALLCLAFLVLGRSWSASH